MKIVTLGMALIAISVWATGPEFAGEEFEAAQQDAQMFLPGPLADARLEAARKAAAQAEITAESDDCYDDFEWDEDAEVCYRAALVRSTMCEHFRAEPPHVIRLVISLPEGEPYSIDVWLASVEAGTEGMTEFCDQEMGPSGP